MTLPLCLNCGFRKVGAYCPCPECRCGLTGDKDPDILFNGHSTSARTIEQFGEVIGALRGAIADPEVRFWAFISWVPNQPSKLLSAEPPPLVAEAVRGVLKRTALQPLEVESGALRPDDFSGPESTLVAEPAQVQGIVALGGEGEAHG